MQEMMKLRILAILTLIFAGCSHVSIDPGDVIASFVDSATETKEEREVRRDTSRWKKGEPLQHHSSVDNLKSHRQGMQFREWEKDRYLDQLEEKAEQQRQFERNQELYDSIKDIPIDGPLLFRLTNHSSTIGTVQQSKKGFSVKELSAFLVQIESQLPQDELIVDMACIGKKWEVTTVKTTAERGQRIYFAKINEEWKRKSVDSYLGDSTKHQKLSMSIKEICAFFIHVEGLLPQDEGIVGVEMFGKQIKVKTASVYIPLAGRGHFITFEKANGEWEKIAQNKWIS